MSLECGEVSIGVQEFGVSSDRDRSDEAVDWFSDGLTAASAHSVKRSCVVVVPRH